MCGIIGYTGYREVSAVLIDGLKKLEYRGYDSAGVALQGSEKLVVTKTAGSVDGLKEMLINLADSHLAGIGHTRWATHGRPTEVNAHPHSSCCEDIALIHNGIIENHSSLKKWLSEEAGHVFRSDTDTEVLAHLIEEYYENDLLLAVRKAAAKVKGSYALVVLSSKEPGRMVCARQDSPLIIGLGERENFVASDIPALLAYTKDTIILEDGEFASITKNDVQLYNQEGNIIHKDVFKITWDVESAEKGGYEHFMLKEIMEQPVAVRETLRQRLDMETGEVTLDELDFNQEELANLEKIYILACGTAYHAGLVGKFILEKLAGIPVEVDVASEFRYRDPIINKNQLAIVISQSGETADTLAALRLVKSKGVKVLAITNVVGSSVSREADQVLYTWAGLEIAVASTKAYLSQLAALYLLSLYFADKRSGLANNLAHELAAGLVALPGQLKLLLNDDNLQEIKRYCEKLAKWDRAFFVGRNLDFPVAMEGALKLKEISYIHAEAYAAGELKHGPLALIEEGVPVIAIATQKHILEKTLSNVQEVKARGGDVFMITKKAFAESFKKGEACFYLPDSAEILMPVLSAVVTQLIAYYTAVIRGSSVDKPRNLAKSVTVE